MAHGKVAVIGAGAAGLVTARELIRAGFDVTVFEQGKQVGGIWAYTPDIEDDPLGRTPSARIHTSLYASLRTNLPRDLMAFMDYTFDSAGGGDDDWPRYPHHSLVLQYLERYARDMELNPIIRFDERVSRVSPRSRGWLVASTRYQDQFDAVALCNGHYTRPRLPALPGIDQCDGVIHSHNYRTPDRFAGRRVALWGTAASGADISMEVARVAKEVLWCGDGFADLAGKRAVSGARLMPSPTRFEAGSLCFPAGERTLIDDFIFCTGYEYEFPFLAPGILEVVDNHVSPLFQEIIPPAFPTLALIGIPYLVVPFPLFEMQARWFAAALSGRMALPTEAEMLVAIQDREITASNAGRPERHFHKLGDGQTDYYNALARQCGAPPVPGWFTELARLAQQSRLADPAGFRELALAPHGPTVVASIAPSTSR